MSADTTATRTAGRDRGPIKPRARAIRLLGKAEEIVGDATPELVEGFAKLNDLVAALPADWKGVADARRAAAIVQGSTVVFRGGRELAGFTAPLTVTTLFGKAEGSDVARAAFTDASGKAGLCPVSCLRAVKAGKGEKAPATKPAGQV